MKNIEVPSGKDAIRRELNHEKKEEEAELQIIADLSMREYHLHNDIRLCDKKLSEEGKVELEKLYQESRANKFSEILSTTDVVEYKAHIEDMERRFSELK